MSSPEARLKEQIADLLNVSTDSVTPATSLDVPRLRSSTGSLILQSVVRSATGKSVVITKGVRNFGELLALANGDGRGSASAPSDAGAPAAPSAAPGPSDLPSWLGLAGCGVDIEEVAMMPGCADFWSNDFYTANFSPEEIAYCVTQADPRPHFAARWCAKEALKKSSPGYLPLRSADIQVVRNPSGSVGLQVRSAGQWRDAPVVVSLSHSGHSAIAMVILQQPTAPLALPATTAALPAQVEHLPVKHPRRKSWLQRLLTA